MPSNGFEVELSDDGLQGILEPRRVNCDVVEAQGKPQEPLKGAKSPPGRPHPANLNRPCGYFVVAFRESILGHQLSWYDL